MIARKEELKEEMKEAMKEKEAEETFSEEISEERNHDQANSMEEEIEERKERKVVIPGEVIATGTNFLPGENAKREGKDIISTRFGLEDISGRIAKVIPLSGVYLPRQGNIVIGRIAEITFNGWLIEINSPYPAFLPISECRGFISKREDLSAIYNFDDMIVAKVNSVKAKGVDLTMRDRGLHKLNEGIVVQVNSNKVPRIIGRKGSMVTMIKDYTRCDVIVGQNGIVWIRGENLKDELLAREVVKLITEKSMAGGLTEFIKEFLEKKAKK